jgi:hypothetical protein
LVACAIAKARSDDGADGQHRGVERSISLMPLRFDVVDESRPVKVAEAAEMAVAPASCLIHPLTADDTTGEDSP